MEARAGWRGAWDRAGARVRAFGTGPLVALWLGTYLAGFVAALVLQRRAASHAVQFFLLALLLARVALGRRWVPAAVITGAALVLELAWRALVARVLG